jgi:hypothetical protein
MGNANNQSATVKKKAEEIQSLGNFHGIPNSRTDISYENQNISNDNLGRIKNSLKFLHKNNFVSLTFEDINAYYIQMNWKNYVINKIRASKKGLVEVIYSSIDKNPNCTSRQDRLFVNLDSRRYPYKCYDVVNYKPLRKVVEVIMYY